jgi:hypothetical protein
MQYVLQYLRVSIVLRLWVLPYLSPPPYGAHERRLDGGKCSGENCQQSLSQKVVSTDNRPVPTNAKEAKVVHVTEFCIVPTMGVWYPAKETAKPLKDRYEKGECREARLFP